ncbi:hypothetical protein KP509_22G041500 [Ceratopteris richardii]|nr:hypothetical protein KP509_22G041500 [Ceratopteris richardii]
MIRSSSSAVFGMNLDSNVNGLETCRNAQNSLVSRKKKNSFSVKKGAVDSEANTKVLSDQKMGKPLDQGSRLLNTDGHPQKHHIDVKDPKDSIAKCQHGIMGVAKSRKSFDSIQSDMVESVESNHVPVLSIVAEHESSHLTCKTQSPRFRTVQEGLKESRRASTDILDTQNLGYASMHVPETPDVEGKCYEGSARFTSMPFSAERWSGPTFVNSPSPSSLPVPKFSVIRQKIPSLDVIPSPLEQQKSKILKPTEFGSMSTEPLSCNMKGESDVAFATKSLRKLLRLDP